jgi:hypothetical protein
MSWTAGESKLGSWHRQLLFSSSQCSDWFKEFNQPLIEVVPGFFFEAKGVRA